MTAEQRIERAEDHVRLRLSGRASYAMMVGLLADLTALAAAEPGLRLLVDETELRPGLVTPGDMRRFVGSWRAATALQGAFIAVVASAPVTYGMNRMFQLFVDDEIETRMNVFRSEDDALAWLRSRGERQASSSSPRPARRGARRGAT